MSKTFHISSPLMVPSDMINKDGL